MLKWLAPDRYVRSIHALRAADLSARGIRGLIVDLDNTLTPWRDGMPDDDLVRWVEGFRGESIEVCIVSNNRPGRVGLFGDALRVPVVPDAGKPRRTPFRRAMALLGTAPPETAVLGDQIFTDILGGNRLGLYTILVTPVTVREFVGTRLVRRLERRILAVLHRRGLLRDPEPEGGDSPHA